MIYRASIIATAAAMLALAGCSGERKVDERNASTADVAKKVADAGIKLQPGRWELSMKLTRFEVEGLPPEAKKAMEGIFASGRTFASCLTQEEADKPDGKFFGQESNDCKYDSFTMGDGKIDAKMTCRDKSGGGETRMTMAGTYSADTYNMAMTMRGSAPDGKTMDMGMDLTSRRVGECTGKEEG